MYKEIRGHMLSYIGIERVRGKYNKITLQSITFIRFLSKFQCSKNKRGKYVEIKFQLDATEVFIADLTACSTCFGHHYAHHQELKSIIQWLLPVVFRAVVFKLLVWCGAEDYVSVLQHPANRTHNPQLHTRPAT